jgi:ABC-type lipoprotein release transport system permease subunit
VLVFRMAWRNVWRNPRRTGIVFAAVAIGIAGALLSMSVNYGMVYQMVDTAIATDLGHLQIHATGFDENPELRIRLADGGRDAVEALADLEGVLAWAPRVRGEGLATSPRASVGVRLVGIDPEREAEISLVADSMTGGRYLHGDARSAVIGEALARRLAVGIGDKIVVSAQDLAGDLNGQAMRVGGLFRSPSRELDRNTLFVHLDRAQQLLGLGQAISEIVVIADGRGRIPGLRGALEERLPELEVRSWDQLQPILVYLVDLAEQSAVFVYLAIFIAMAFGIANVLLMAVFERVREIGVMMAVGLSRRRLVVTIVAESVLVTFFGVITGFAVALVTVAALQDGIDLSYFSEGLTAYGIGSRIVPVLRVEDFTMPGVVALVTAAVASAWPALRAVRLRPAEAVRHT